MSKVQEAKEALTAAVVSIMYSDRYRWQSGCMLIGTREIGDRGGTLPTACTDGVNEWYNPDFLLSLSIPERRFLVLHEVRHKLLMQLTTWQHLFREDPRLANMAADFVVNAQLIEENPDGFASMTGPLSRGCYDPKYRGWDTAAVFHDLKKQGQGQGQGFDQHDWEAAGALSEEQQTQVRSDMDRALRQGRLVAGKTGTGGLPREMEALLQPKVDWRDALRQFVASTCPGGDYATWKRPNRRHVGAGVYMPTTETQRVREIVVAPDMSGSTFMPGVLGAFMSELKSICETVKPEKTHVLYWDTEITRAETHVDPSTIMTTTKPAGGGGTVPACVPQYMAKTGIEPQVAIVLTDGHVSGWGTWPCPVLWLILDNPSARPPVGRALHVRTADLR